LKAGIKAVLSGKAHSLGYRLRRNHMASIKDVEKVADQLEGLVGQLRSELRNGPDFQKLMEIADSISEQADQAAGTFSTVNEALMSRIGELRGSRSSSGSSRGAKEKSSS
jgi:hypothetical protein